MHLNEAMDEFRRGGVICDVDGTLLDSMPTWHDAGARYLATLGIEAEPNLGDILFAETSETGARYMIKRYGLDQSVPEVAEGINEQMKAFYYNEVMPKAGAADVLQRMKDAGVPMTVATSTDRQCMEPALERLGMLDYFLQIYCCREMDTTKDSPDIFFAAAERMDRKPEDVWVIEDGLYSIRTAKAAGFHTVGIYDSVSEVDQKEIRELTDFYYTNLLEFDLI